MADEIAQKPLEIAPVKKVIGVPFSKDNQPKNSGRKRGLKSMSALLDKWSQLETPEALLTNIKKMFPRIRTKLKLEDAATISTWMEAVKGEGWAMQFIVERRDGKVPQKVLADIKEHTTIFNVKSTGQQEAIEKGDENADNL